MAGTMLLLKRQGWEIHFMNIASGHCGSVDLPGPEIAGVRRGEAARAAQRAGAVWHPPLVDDLDIFYEKTTLARLAAVMREVAPEILLVHSPQDYMEDHMNACRLAVTAAFARGMKNFATDPPRPVAEVQMAVYHAQPHSNRGPLRRPVLPEFYVDIASVLEDKAACLAQHRSQKRWLDASQGMDSYLENMRGMGRELGRWSGRFSSAEGWRRHHPAGYGGPDFEPLRAELGQLCLANAAYLKTLAPPLPRRPARRSPQQRRKR